MFGNYDSLFSFHSNKLSINANAATASSYAFKNNIKKKKCCRYLDRNLFKFNVKFWVSLQEFFFNILSFHIFY